MRASTIFAAVLLLLTGCGDDDTSGGTDAGDVDAGEDAGPVAIDAATDDAGGGDDAGPPADTWGTFAMGFFATYCTECHGGAARDYTTMTHVMRDADRIR